MNADEGDSDHRVALARLARARGYLLVCFYTLPLYIAGLVILLNNRRDITAFMLLYMALYALFAVNLVVRRCPRCRQQFFVRSLFLNPFTRKCLHCGTHLPRVASRKF